MAKQHTHTIDKVGKPIWTDTEEDRDGSTQTIHERSVEYKMNGKPARAILRSQSEKLIKNVKEGDTLTGYVFKDDSANQSPNAWRFRVRRKDNEHLLDDGHTPPQAQNRPSQARSGGGVVNMPSYTFDEFVGLYETFKEFGVDDLAAAELTKAASRLGIKAPEGATATPDQGTESSMNDAMRDKTLEVIYDTIKKKGMKERLDAATEVTDTDLLEIWKDAHANVAVFAKKLNDQLPKLAEPEEEVADDDNIPF
jgi:hypothetical protein